MYVLIGAAVLKFITGSFVEGAIVLLVVILNAMIGYYQERKADESLSSITKLLSSKATIESIEGRLSIDAEELVPGDRVYLAPGDIIPADLRIESVNELKIDESILTGEPDAVVKTVTRLDEQTAFSRSNQYGLLWNASPIRYRERHRRRNWFRD